MEARVVLDGDPVNEAGKGCRVGFLPRDVIRDPDRLRRVLDFQFYRVKTMMNASEATHIRRIDHENVGAAIVEAVLNRSGDPIPPPADKKKLKRTKQQAKLKRSETNQPSTLKRIKKK